jgi:hypothetical protein
MARLKHSRLQMTANARFIRRAVAHNIFDCALEVTTCHEHAGIVENLSVIAKEDDPRFCSHYGYWDTLLCSAAQVGDETAVRLYLAARINHNACDRCGRSALYLASGFYGSVMTLLIAAGANLNMGDHDGQTPLMHHKTGVEIFLVAKQVFCVSYLF